MNIYILVFNVFISIKTKGTCLLLLQRHILDTVPVVAGVPRQRGPGRVQRPLVVTRAPCRRHAAAVQQVEAACAVAAVVAGGDTLHLRGAHVQTRPRTRAALRRALCCRQARHARRTHA